MTSPSIVLTITRSPRWIVAAERIITSRPYLHRVARIAPQWVVEVAPHLVSKRYLEPVWDARRGRVLVRELASIFGLTLGTGRRVNYADIDEPAARALFIQAALVNHELGRNAAFLSHNRKLKQQVLALEARIRSRRLLVGDKTLEQFYAERLPASVSDRASLFRWLKKKGQRGRGTLSMAMEDLTTGPVARLEQDYPLTFIVAEQPLTLRYCFPTGKADDGITVRVPAPLLSAIHPGELDWLVPGWLPEKVTALIKGLPKPLRRQLVPVPDTVAALLGELNLLRGQPFMEALSAVLWSTRAVHIPADQLATIGLPDEFAMNVEIVDEQGRVVAHQLEARRPQPANTDDPLRQRRRGIAGRRHSPLGAVEIARM